MGMKLVDVRSRITREDWLRIAELSGTSGAYLDQLSLRFRRPSVALALRIESAVSEVLGEPFPLRESLIFDPLRSGIRKNKRNQEVE